MKLLMPIGAAALALTGALAAACFVKAFGVTFLGHWRGHHRPHAHDADWPMRIGMLLAALTCIGLGILPTVFIEWMDVLAEQFVGSNIGTTAGAYGWMWLTPISSERASYSGSVVLFGILGVVLAAYLLLHIRPGKVHRGPIWDCGFEKLTPRMQYTATSFSMPIRRIFGHLFDVREKVELTAQSAHPAFPRRLVYRLRVADRLWAWLYKPVVDACFWMSRAAGRLQQGRIQAYLIYSFVTIIVLLVLAR